jgi:hypothetical protein
MPASKDMCTGAPGARVAWNAVIATNKPVATTAATTVNSMPRTFTGPASRLGSIR